jgi:hypothetical protein
MASASFESAALPRAAIPQPAFDEVKPVALGMA